MHEAHSRGTPRVAHLDVEGRLDPAVGGLRVGVEAIHARVCRHDSAAAGQHG